LRRWPGLTLAVDQSEVTWRKRPGLKAIDRLPVASSVKVD
jgi:cytochrome P450 PksS